MKILDEPKELTRDVAADVVRWFMDPAFTEYVAPMLKQECEAYRSAALAVIRSGGNVAVASSYAAESEAFNKLMVIYARAKDVVDSA